jgi:hypothetical protein
VGHRIEAHPLTLGRAEQVHRQVGVDEDEARPVERGAHAVAAVGGEHGSLDGRDRLALHQLDPRAHPDRSRARLEEAAAGEHDLHGGVPAHALARREELERLCALATGRGVVLLPVGDDVRLGQAPAARPHHLAARPLERALEHLDTPARPSHPGAHGERLDRDGCQDLDRDAPQAGALARLAQLERPREEGGGRPGVLSVRVPGAAGELGGRGAVAVERVERVGHGGPRYTVPGVCRR